MEKEKNKTENITVKKEEAGARLDKFLAQKLSDFSRAYFQKLIRKGKVLINSQNKSLNYKLKEGDNVTVNLVAIEEIDMSPDAKILERIRIVYEDEDLIIIDKPAGIVVHPSATTKSGTLVNALLARWPEIINVGEDKSRPGIVHRLDKDTSGLMIIAKNNNVFSYFKKLFQMREIEKHYQALVWGKVEKDEGEINLSIMRSRSIPVKQVAIDEHGSDKIITGARHAITKYKVLKRYKDWTLIEVFPKTGRMHQIRVHFRAIGHPIANDKKYAFRQQETIKGLDRHFLHASYIKFVSPKGFSLEFVSNLPEDLLNAIKDLPDNI